VIGGSLAQRPHYGGHSWVFLQYLLGFRDLGWEVLFLDRLDEGMAVDRLGRSCPVAESENLRYLEQTMREFGLEDCFALDAGREGWLGVPKEEVLRRVRESRLLINVMGFIDNSRVLAGAPVKVFLDIDPGFGQMWKELELADIFGPHDFYLTVGANIGQPSCRIPKVGIDWIPTNPPVVLRHWPRVDSGEEAFTSLGSWRGPFGPVEYRGQRYGLRVHEFRKFVDLPTRTHQRFRAAIEIDEADSPDAALLRSTGWELQDPMEAARDPSHYRRYIQSAWAEFLVAKGIYVGTGSGWVSDRSVCFLASGKPVLAQETGLSANYPTGDGLVTFANLDEACEGAARIVADYRYHSKRARELAEEYFDSRKVLTGILNRVGLA
jgi:hypothetical protein